ncbi:VapE domain-containing protein [Novosphingobium colocasiae]|uniref:VapE domain-containing protein n=1 Tax=Novosphingobium colocasiae TaxID=1256513 RepID=UPI0035B41C64
MKDPSKRQSAKDISLKKPPPAVVRFNVFDFPDPPDDGRGPPPTIENTKYLLEQHRITVRYNVIKKRTEYLIPSHAGSVENISNTSITAIQSMAARHSLLTGPIPAHLEAIADENQYNPVAEWIHSKPWDGEDRLPAFFNTVTTDEGFPESLKHTLMHKWARSAVAAAVLPSGFRSRGVLVLQGEQGIGKSSFCRNLIPPSPLRDEVIKLDHHMEAGNKDSQLGAITHWIVEFGEVEGSLKKDISRLKGFTTNDKDKIRRPYARAETEYQRRTVFLATVNQIDYLIDPTGNSRWWTLPCVAIDYEHNVDMQQLWAQLAVEVEDGGIWWLTGEEEAELEQQNRKHRSYSLVVDRLEAVLDFNPSSTSQPVAKTASELLEVAGIDRPTNPQAKECAAYLRERVGKSRRINGREKWYVHLLGGGRGPFEQNHEDEPQELTWNPETKEQGQTKPKKPTF